MSNLIKSYLSIFLASVGMLFVSLPAMGADSPTGQSIINCSVEGLSEDYKSHVCLPLQAKANELLGGYAKAPEPTLMIEKLNMLEYRAKGVDAIISSTKKTSSVNPSGGTSGGTITEVPWTLQ